MKKLILIVEHLPVTLMVVSLQLLINSDANYYYIIGIFIFGWLIDADHLIDYFYYLFKCKKKLSISEFFSGSYFRENYLVIILGHSIELSLIIFFTGLIFDDIGLCLVSLAHFLHLIQDLYSNKVNFFGYSLIYRLKNKFLLSKICTD